MTDSTRPPEGEPPQTIPDRLRHLEDRMAELAQRLSRIERLLGVPPPRPEPAKPPAARPSTPLQEIFKSPPHRVAPQPTPQPPPSAPSAPRSPPSGQAPTAVGPPPALSGFDLEALIGGRWALWIGSLLVFLAVGFFLAYTWHNIAPIYRVLIGLVAGALFLGTGEFLRDRIPDWFARGLSGSGIALFYLSIWASFRRYDLVSFDTALILMVATTAMCVYMSLRFDSPGLLAFATLGGFLTPMLLHTGGAGEDRALSFLGYLALLDAGILAVSLSRRWRPVYFLAFLSTLVLVFGWADRLTLTDALRSLIFSFATVFFLLFLGAAAFYSVRRNEPINEYDLALFLASTFVYALAGHSLILFRLGEVPSLFVLLLGLFYVALFLAVRSAAPANVVLRRACLGVALVLFTLAVPIQLKGHWVAVSWSLEALLLSSIALSARSLFVRYSSVIVWAVALIATLIAITRPHPFEIWVFLANSVALPLAVFTVASLGMGFLELARKDDPDAGALSAVFHYFGIIAGAGFTGHEAYQAVFTAHYPTPASAPLAALCAVTILLSGYALGVFYAGLFHRIAALQGSALILVPVILALPLWGSFALPVADWRPFLNLRFLAFAVVTVTLFAFTHLIQRYPDRFSLRESSAHLWTILLAVLFAFVALNAESYFLFYDLFPDRNLEFFFNMSILGFIFAFYLLFWGAKTAFPPSRLAAYSLSAFAIWILLYESFFTSPEDWLPILNWRGFAFLVAAIALIEFSSLSRDAAPSLDPGERSLLASAWVIGAGIALWGLTEETYLTVRYFSPYFSDWPTAAQLAISLVWTASAGILMSLGFWRNLALARWLALAIFGVTIAKLFLYDLGFLSLPYRWLSFGALGIVLIAVAYRYARRHP